MGEQVHYFQTPFVTSHSASSVRSAAVKIIHNGCKTLYQIFIMVIFVILFLSPTARFSFTIFGKHQNQSLILLKLGTMIETKIFKQ